MTPCSSTSARCSRLRAQRHDLRSRTSSCRPSFACSSRSYASRGLESCARETTSVDGSSEISTTERNSACSGSAWLSGCSRTRVDGNEEAAALVDEAEAEAQSALRELRELARGIHPAILTDQGLDAAVRTLAERAPIPVR